MFIIGNSLFTHTFMRITTKSIDQTKITIFEENLVILSLYSDNIQELVKK